MISFSYVDIDEFSAKAFNPKKSQIKEFETLCYDLIDSVKTDNEEFQKNKINDVLKKAFGYECNVKDKIDSCIYDDGVAKVLIEVKQLSNKMEFPKSKDNPLSKAFAQSIFYFLKEHIENNNNEIKHIIICNPISFFVFEASEFVKFKNDKNIKKLYKNTTDGTDKRREKLYKDIESYLQSDDFNRSIKYTHFELNSGGSLDTLTLSKIYKLLSPQVLLNKNTIIDANTLNKRFYDELLYILGLREIEQNGKKLITQSDTKNSLSYAIKATFPDLSDEQTWELIILWNNRILFLALLESMLLSFKHTKEPFLSIEKIKNFSMLSQLFFEVLAKKEDERNSEDFSFIPYLNSSLFDKNELEKKGNDIKLLTSHNLALFPQSILKDTKQKELPLLEYLFSFLQAYDFTTTPKDLQDGIKINHDKLINSAVLGLVFEKLNGYKEGSFYTPSFITSYMCKESITQIVLDRFNAANKEWNAKSLSDIESEIVREIRERKTPQNEIKAKYKKILFSIKICDPAVGSGHFLVSALNEIIFIAFRLGLLDSNITNLSIENDEIIIKQNGKIFEYQKPDDESLANHQIQQEIFNLKKEIIESCLFGVDINPNSCEITKLRLWIELLKYSYYIFDKGIAKGLQTLPNIDINIKCGNSLISNFSLDSRFSGHMTQNLKASLDDYKLQVDLYKNALSNKAKIKQNIESLKIMIKNNLIATSPINTKIKENLREFVGIYGDECFGMDSSFGMEMIKIQRENSYKFQPTLEQLEPDPIDKKGEKLLDSIYKDFQILESLRNTQSFEWRFEFPEVLDENGDFLGFDLIIGNPPYMQAPKGIFNPKIFPFSEAKDKGKQNLYKVFVEQGYNLIKENGIVSFITQSSIMCDLSAQFTRELLLKYTQMHYFIEFKKNQNIFTNVIQGVAIIEFKKQNPKKDSTFKIAINNTQANMQEIEFEIIKQSDILKLFPFYEIPLIKKGDMQVALKLKSEDKIPLKNLIQYSLQGNINTIHLKRIQSKEKTGVFLMKGENIHRYYIDYEDLMYCIDNGEMKKHYEFNQNYEIIAMQGITGTTDKYRIHCTLLESKNTNYKFVFLHSTKMLFVECKEKAKFLIALLHSKVLNYLFRLTSTNNNVNLYELENLPIPKLDSTNQNLADKITALVDKILESKAKDSNSDTTMLESQIDDLVYKLYNLSDDEIKIIEG